MKSVMSKRYVFWRKPNGTPARENDGKHAPVEILSRLGCSSILNPNGTVAFGLTFFEGCEIGLKSVSVVLDPNGQELNDNDAWRIVWKGLTAAAIIAGEKQPLKELDVLTEADKAAAIYFRAQPTDYIVVSSLSIAVFPFKCAKIKNHKIEPISSRTKYPSPEIVSQYPGLSNHVKSSKYQLVKVSTSGRSVYEAMETGLDALNLLRGLWNLFSTFRSWSRTIGGTPKEKPIGVVHTGPVHTLHYNNGALVGEDKIFWYKPGYIEDYDLFHPEDDRWKKIESHRNWAIRRINKSPFRKELEELIVRYAAALDQSDYGVAFLQMWGVLEKLTATVGGSYDETIKRAAWPFVDGRILVKELLSCMRLRRNLYVHSSVKRQDMDQAIYVVKDIVDVHLTRLIRNGFNASSIEEYARRLTLSTDVSSLRREKRLLTDVIKYLSKK